MKKLSVFASFLFPICALGVTASAQESYNTPANASQVLDLTKIVGAYNVRVFDRAGVPIGSNQGTVCVALFVAGGSGCSNAQARAASARIYPQTQPGREEYFQFEIALPAFVSQLGNVPSSNVAARCSLFAAKNQAAKDAELTEIGQPTGSTACPYR